MFQSELGYIMEGTRNNQKVQKGNVCWRNLLVSFVRKEDLETGAKTDFILRVLTDMNLTELSSMFNFELDGVILASIYSEGRNFMIKGASCSFYVKQVNLDNILRILMLICAYLIVVIIKLSEALKKMMRSGAKAIGVEYFVPKNVWSSDCSGENIVRSFY
jgi:hypothetical protein